MSPSDMNWIPGGLFCLGSERHYPEEAPVHEVRLAGFWIDRTTVTNAAYAAFVEATNYVTVAERPLDAGAYPGANTKDLAPGALVFRQPPGPVDRRDVSQWWSYVPCACWRRPEGQGSDWRDRADHPVVHVAYQDAAAFAAWCGKDLPMEAEWEAAARGGLVGAEFAWGDEFAPGAVPMANTWQGEFPWRNTAEDGFVRTAPVGSYPPNGYGLADMAGNVWQWTSDWYAARRGGKSPCCAVSRSLDPGAARRHSPTQGDQGRLVPLRARLLPPIPARRPPAANGRYHRQPHWVPLRAAVRLKVRRWSDGMAWSRQARGAGPLHPAKPTRRYRARPPLKLRTCWFSGLGRAKRFRVVALHPAQLRGERHEMHDLRTREMEENPGRFGLRPPDRRVGKCGRERKQPE